MDTHTRNQLIQRYRDGYQAVVDSLAGASPEQLDKPDGDGWSARMVAHHLADSEMTSAMRLRKLISEEKPVLWGYDEELYSRKLWYTTRPIEVSLLAFRGARESTASILECLTEADWQREGWHSESGRYTTETWLEIYAAHAMDHAAQLRRALANE